MKHERSAVLDAVAPSVEPDDAKHDGWTTTYLEQHYRRFVDDLDIVGRYVRPGEGTFVEVGSSPPFVTGALQRMGYDVVGLDVDPSRFATTIDRLGLTVLAVDIETERFPFEDGSVSAVLMNEVFEHLRMPLAAMREVVRILRPGGLLLMSTPNLRSARGLGSLILRGKCWAIGADPYLEYEKLEWLGHMGHVREYTPVEVKDFVRRCGLEPEAVLYRGEFGPSVERFLYRTVPPSRPFFTLVARKPGP